MGEGGNELARDRIPKLGGFVFTYRQNSSAFWTERRVLDLILMVKGNEELAGGPIPELGAVIRACRQNPSAVGTKCAVPDPISDAERRR